MIKDIFGDPDKKPDLKDSFTRLLESQVKSDSVSRTSEGKPRICAKCRKALKMYHGFWICKNLDCDFFVSDDWASKHLKGEYQ